MEEISFETNKEPDILLPPKTQSKALRWMKENLFSGWFNALLTIVSALVTGYILFHSIQFIFTEDWSVIAVNFRLLMIGQFPVEEVWRIWTAFGLLTVLLGLSWGLWKGSMAHVAVSILAIMVVMLVMPFIQMNTRLILGGNIVLLFLTFFIGTKLPKLKVPVLLVWLLFIPVTIFILNGFGVFEPVSSNIWGGFLLTMLIASVSIIVSFPIGLLLALGRRSTLPVVKYFCVIYIEFIRGIPLITVLFIGQLMIPLFLGNGIEISNVMRAMIGMTLFSAAYLAENIRGGLQSIPKGQYEAAQSLGLSKAHMMTFVILPQALKAVIPACVGQFISIFKDTSLVAIVGLTDLLGMGQKLVANPEFLGKQMEVFLFIGFIYFIFCFLMAHVSRRLEVKLGVGER
ncbi:amino acid ABC transporter permease [Robertmurraya kyonggiensis]|uniref:ABC transporter permease subunit n=1 Tax=Robertmurraya kyonggiensis TaxID=1037680 RepID=A0A4V5P0Y7_9BACI|nr:amino acid ABC transporter permease [Robertmurraya kyonggiensis]TKC16180.1 ABC transporter permease subunit [Robertmurraya kyonggiensis]